MDSHRIQLPVIHCCYSLVLAVLLATVFNTQAHAAKPARQTIKALYISLADHYAALVAYERYRDTMQYADFQLEQMKSWDLLRAYFQTGAVDMAYVMSPLAMSMFQEKPHFRWVGLMHRDGNALAINALLNKDVQLPVNRSERKPDGKVAEALIKAHKMTGRATEISVPHKLSTHNVVLYRYLKDYHVSMALKPGQKAQVRSIVTPPSLSPAFLLGMSNRAQPAAFEQSLSWAELVESRVKGYVAWYSKDVMNWPNGHVECIAVATDQAIAGKFDAVKEVMHFIKRAGADIEQARNEGGAALEAIVEIIRKHIPAHSRESIFASLSPDLRVINYQHLNVDKPGLQQIMDLALESGILPRAIDIDAFADERFGLSETETAIIDAGLKRNQP